MRAARYGVIFYGTGASSARPAHAVAQAIHSLTRELNAQTRFVCMPLHGAGNLRARRMSWHGGPAIRPRSACLEDIRVTVRASSPQATSCGSGETDVALIVSGGPVSRLSVDALRALATIPCILLGSAYDATRLEPTVMFPTAFGVNTSARSIAWTAYRCRCGRCMASPFPRDADVLRAIEARVRSLDRHGSRRHAGGPAMALTLTYLAAGRCRSRSPG